MSLARIILAIFFSISVALLPVAGRAVGLAESADVSVSAAMDDCCDHCAAPCEKAMDHGECMAVCAAMSFGILGSFSSDLLFRPRVAATAPPFAHLVFHSPPGSTPFRPPRV